MICTGRPPTPPRPQPPSDTLTVDRAGAPARVRIVRLAGELDLDCIRTLRATLTDALDASDDVRLDLTELRILDSFAIRELLRAQALAARAGKSFSIVSAAPGVRRLLDAADASGLLLHPALGDTAAAG